MQSSGTIKMQPRMRARRPRREHTAAVGSPPIRSIPHWCTCKRYNFGRWRSDFRRLVAHCLGSRARGRAITRLLRPSHFDYFVLKPKHSGFYSTTLDLLLEHLGARTLILTGLLADSCILFTAQDAHMRGYHLIVPEDCIAARAPSDTRRAVTQMRRTVQADTQPSTALNLRTELRRARGRRA